MARLRPLPRRKVVDILKANGFEEVRSGKHATFKKKLGDGVLTTWVPHHGEVTIFVIQYIIKQAEKQRAEFE
jgi:predicted RNA binding protein YcfA (HicA-like mRNA interferase family)